jgi:hypothetical protein
MWGAFHCATHDEAVSTFGRDDDFAEGLENKSRSPSGMTTRKATAPNNCKDCRDLEQFEGQEIANGFSAADEMRGVYVD